MVRKLNLGGYLASSLWPVESVLGRLVLAEAYRWSTPGPDYEHTRVRTEREEKGKQVIYLYRSFSVSPLKEPSFSRGSLPGNYAGYFKCIISWVCHEASQSLSLPRLRVRRLRPVAGRCTAAGARPESLAAGRGLPAPVFAGGSAGSGSDPPEEEKGKLLGLGG